VPFAVLRDFLGSLVFQIGLQVLKVKKFSTSELLNSKLSLTHNRELLITSRLKQARQVVVEKVGSVNESASPHRLNCSMLARQGAVFGV